MTIQNVALSLILWDGTSSLNEPICTTKVIQKYQRISEIVSKMLEYYSEVSSKTGAFKKSKGKTTVVWSPSGGSGKTTVALAYAANVVSDGKKVIYLNLENFSSTDVYFSQTDKSISSVFSRLGSNIEMLLRSIRQQDGSSGIYYFGQPENYDDINELTEDDLSILVENCADSVDELVIDLSSSCNGRTIKLFEMADSILLVVDSSRVSRVKWGQFTSQNKVYKDIQHKSVMILNRAARMEQSGDIKMILLPVVQSNDPVVVYKTLSGDYWK